MIKEIMIGAGGAVAIFVIMAAVAKYKKEHKDGDSEIEEIYMDEVNLGEIKSWFSGKLSEGRTGIIFRPTPENIKRWKVKIKPTQNMLIQIVYDEEAGEITDYREIAFTELSAKFKELLDENEDTVVVEM